MLTLRTTIRNYFVQALTLRNLQILATNRRLELIITEQMTIVETTTHLGIGPNWLLKTSSTRSTITD